MAFWGAGVSCFVKGAGGLFDALCVHGFSLGVEGLLEVELNIGDIEGEVGSLVQLKGAAKVGLGLSPVSLGPVAIDGQLVVGQGQVLKDVWGLVLLSLKTAEG